MFRPTAFLLAISMVFLGLLSAVSAAAIPQETDIIALGQTFQTLREVKGHWDGADFNPAVDAPNGEKHQVMKVSNRSLYFMFSLSFMFALSDNNQPIIFHLYLTCSHRNSMLSTVSPVLSLPRLLPPWDPRMRSPLKSLPI